MAQKRGPHVRNLMHNAILSHALVEHSKPFSSHLVFTKGCYDQGHQQISGNREDKQQLWPKRPWFLFLDHFKHRSCLTTRRNPRPLNMSSYRASESSSGRMHAHRQFARQQLLAVMGIHGPSRMCNTLSSLCGENVNINPFYTFFSID